MTDVEHAWTVGELRAALEGLPDDAMLCVHAPASRFSDDARLTLATAEQLIPWAHDCDEVDDPDHVPGRDCPTVWGVGLYVEAPAGS